MKKTDLNRWTLSQVILRNLNVLVPLLLFFIVTGVMSAFSQAAMKGKFTKVPLCYKNIFLWVFLSDIIWYQL